MANEANNTNDGNCIVCEKKPQKDGSDVCIECDNYKPKFVAGKDGTGFTFKIPPKCVPKTPLTTERICKNKS